MTPAEFVEVVVMPTVKQHLAARADRRLAYLACIATYSLRDYVAVAKAGGEAAFKLLKRSAQFEQTEDISTEICKICEPAYEIAQGICNGTKHAGSNGKVSFTPGTERTAPVFAFDVPGAGLDEGRLDVPGLEVEHNGCRMLVDHCVQTVLCAFVMTYPTHLGLVDLSGLDPQFRPPPGAPGVR